MAQAHPSFSFPVAASPAGGLGGIPAYSAVEAIGYCLFGFTIFLIAFDISEPSPYDFAAMPTILLWLALGIRLSREALFFVALLLIHHLGLLVALLPHLDQPVSVMWTLASVYLMITAIFFTMFFADDAVRRVELALKAFLASCLVAALMGVVGYFDLFGTADLFTRSQRAAGPFEDPNVLGSFLILGILYIVRDLVTGEGKRPILAVLMLQVLLAGTFLSFSRGAWVATALGIAALLVTTYAASRSGRVRRRIAVLSVVAAALGVIVIAGLLALEEVRSMFEMRAQVTQSYDQGETGRFGNQLRAIPLLIESPNGFGPLRFRAIFNNEPHNSYIGAFANGGWMAGLSFIGMMLATAYVGLRLCFRPSPYQRQAQIVSAAHVTLFAQSFQIDIDHWRHAFLIWGMIWGLEAAQRRWHAAERSAMPAWGFPSVAVAGQPGR